MNQSQSRKRKEKKISGHPGIFKVTIWCKNRRRFVDPRQVKGCRAKPFRAVKRAKMLGKWKKIQAMFDSLEEAREWRTTPGNVGEGKKGRSMTVMELVSEWREQTKPPKIEQSTWEIYGQVILHFGPLRFVPVEELNAKDIDGWLNTLKSSGYPKPKSRFSFLRELRALGTMLKWYREYKNERFHSPILSRHRRDSFFKKPPVQRRDFLDERDLEQFLDRLRMCHKPVYYFLAAFQALCGARISEACGLEWDAVDFERKRVEIKQICRWTHGTKQPYLVAGTKTHDCRVIAIPDRLVSLLREWKEVGANGPLVFHKDGSELRYNAIQSAYKKAFRALGLPERSTHILRHTFATIHANQTKDIRATQAAMGHKDLRITQHYAKAGEETQRNALTDFKLGRAVPHCPARSKSEVKLRVISGA